MQANIAPMRHENNPDGANGRENISVTVNVAAFTVHTGGLHVLLVTQDGPTSGPLALPGETVRHDEDLAQCAKRVVEQITEVRPSHVEQLHAYGDPDRDPRGRDVGIVYSSLIHRPKPSGGSGWLEIGDALDERLAFDHDMMLIRALDDIRTRIEETSIATELLTEEFTLAELRAVYEAVWGGKLGRGNFARRAAACPGFLKNTGYVSTEEHGRPAGLFVADQAGPLKIPIRRPWLGDPTIPEPPFNGRG